jgi:chromosome segregation ATPase
MGFFSFTSIFAKKKAEQTGHSIVQVLAKWDPETSSKAELEQMEKRLNKLVQEVAQARQIYQKEQDEADAINKLYRQKLKAAEILQQKQAQAPDNAEITDALNQLVSGLEEMFPEIEREELEAKEAKEFMKELEEVAKASAAKLKNAKKVLTSAKQDMKRAEIREQRAKERQEQAARLSGLRDETDELGSALAAMKKNAENANTRAEAATMKAKLLGTSSESEKPNDLIASAIEEAGQGPVKPSNISDRLAALKKK